MDNAQMLAVEEKLQNLLNRYKRLQKENETLKKELHAAGTELAHNRNTIARLQEKLDVQQLGLQSMSEQQKQQLSKRIDAYLKEINKSLALLNA